MEKEGKLQIQTANYKGKTVLGVNLASPTVVLQVLARPQQVSLRARHELVYGCVLGI